jgi:adenosylcobinamide-phosphate synthase
MWRIDPWQLSIAVLLDLLLGDPRGWPHVARLTGALAIPFEAWMTSFMGRTVFSGALFWGTVCGVMLGGYAALYLLLRSLNPLLSWWLAIIVIYQTIAARDLHRHIREIIRPLASGNLPLARQKLAMIVGRDTEKLDEVEISRAGIESAAESITDGILAPLFWAFVAGAPGALLYRVANTLDSMVGHRDAKYERVGKVSARIDDLLSWIPARLTALMFWFWRPSLSLDVVAREARSHASPNAGWGESAMAHVLNVRLGGDNWYQGDRVAGPIFNPAGRSAQLPDLRKALGWMWKTTGLFFILCLIGACLRRYYHAN